MCRRVGKAAPRSGHAHDIIDERRRPGEIAVFLGREHAPVLVVHAGEALLALADRQAQPPILADPLPQSLGALVVIGQLGARVHHRLTKGAPFAIGDLYGRLACERLIRPAREGRDMVSPVSPLPLGPVGPAVGATPPASSSASASIAPTGARRRISKAPTPQSDA